MPALLPSVPRDLAGVRHALSGARLELETLRLAIALKRFNPSQPQAPAGNPNGGQWTGEGGGWGTPRVEPASSRPRVGSSGTRVIRGRVHEVTPGQEARLDVSAAQARAFIRDVQQRDPSWRPRPSIYEGVEGEILANQSDALQAAARLRELGGRESAARPLNEVLSPGDRLIGSREARASISTRTVTSPEFNELLEAVSPNVQIVRSPPDYQGVWYQRTDGTIFGVRRSPQHGITLDVIQNDHPLVRGGFKVHQK
jgi:hypothetical protein